MNAPLAGLRVLDMSRVLAGPFAGRMLADLGADVVKLEPPEGDITRLWGASIHGISGYFNQQNAGKRGVSIDLGVPEGVALVKALAARADVLIENFRPDVMVRLGLGQHVEVAMIDAMLVTDDHLHAVLDDVEEADAPRSEVWQTAGGAMVISGDFRHLWRQLNGVERVPDPAPPGADLAQKIAARRAAFGHHLTVTCADRAAVIAALDRMNLAWGDVRTSRMALELPTVRQRGTITTVDDRGGGRRPVTQSPYRFSGATSAVRAGAPHQGEHNAAVLRDWLGPELGDPARWAPALCEVARA